jgi:hypothetical protein
LLRHKKKHAAALSGGKVLLESTLVLLLLGRGLESTVSELGRGVDPLEADLLEGPSGGLGEHGLSEGHDTLLNTRDGTLEHNEVVVDLTVADETTERSDGLLGDIDLSGGVVVSITLTNAVDLVVDGSTVMVSHLSGTCNCPLNVRRMPSTNTGDLSETLVCLTRKLLGTPTGGNTVETVTLGNGNDVNHLVLLEDAGDVDGLLEELLAERDLVGDGATVDLDLHKVGLLLLEGGLSDLGVGQDTDDSAVLLNALELAGDGGTVVLGVLLGVLGESLLLALVPVLVESALDLVAQMLGPNGGEGSQASGSLDVSNKTNNDHRWGIDDSDSLNNLLLVGLGARSVEVTNDGGHTSLVTHSGGQVDGLLGVILGEGLDLSTVTSSALPGQVSQGAVAGSLKLSVLFTLSVSQAN